LKTLNQNQKKLIVIIGPTAIGKTALSIALAQHYSSEIISCDSRQFFKEMKIGTAVPSDLELSQAKHHFIQNKSIHENYTVGDFEKEAIAKLNELFETNNYAILIGGSGLYVDAILNGLDSFPEIDNSIRLAIQDKYELFGIEYLQQQLQELDTEYYKKINLENPQTLQNPQRMMRFLEVCIGSSKPYSSFLKKHETKRNFTPIIIGLEAHRKIIYDRINKRVDLMMQNGLLQEAQNLLQYKNLNALQTVGYRELFQYLENEISLETAIGEIKKNTRRFSKRQMTWFKRTDNVVLFNFDTPIIEIIKSIS
jgi:tRNA dimethylallyltransferase